MKTEPTEPTEPKTPVIQDDSDLEGEEVIHNACGLEDGKCESCQ